MKNSGRINDAVDKLSSLQTLIDETDKRINKVDSTREGITNTEERLLKLSKDADDQLKVLQSLAKAEVAKKPSSKQETVTPQLRETVIALKRRNWSVEQIAQAVKRTEAEVELILELGA